MGSAHSGRFGMNYRNQGNSWTEAEVNYLRENYATLGPYEVAKHLTRHPLHSCTTKANRMGLKLTPETVNRIRSGARRGDMQSLIPPKPFENIDPEFVKVASIWRVGARYLAQAHQNNGVEHEPA